MAYTPRRRVGYFYDPDVGNFYYAQGHPMKPHRMRMTHNLLLAYGLFDKMDVLTTPRATDREMTRFHSDEYINFLKLVTPESLPDHVTMLSRFNVLEDCPVFDGLWEYCQIAAGGSLAGAARLNAGESSIAINWAGGLHHAKKAEASGFCYINDCVLAILELLKVHARVLYVDIDIHHGDGVEEAFYTTDRVMTASFHKFGDYFPGTGDVGDIGIARGKHYSANFPLRDGIDDDSYREIFIPVMTRIMEWYKPGAVVLQCGADSLSGDRLGCFNLSLHGHAQCVDFFKRYDTPLLLLGGGGYTIRNVARCWAYETSRVVGEKLSDELPFSENYEFYGPEFRLHIVPSNMENHNTQMELEKTKARIFENLRNLPHAPSTPFIDTPRLSPLGVHRREHWSDEDDPDVRRKNRRSKAVIDYAGSDDEDDQYISSLRHAKRRAKRTNFPRRRTTHLETTKTARVASNLRDDYSPVRQPQKDAPTTPSLLPQPPLPGSEVDARPTTSGKVVNGDVHVDDEVRQVDNSKEKSAAENNGDGHKPFASSKEEPTLSHRGVGGTVSIPNKFASENVSKHLSDVTGDKSKLYMRADFPSSDMRPQPMDIDKESRPPNGLNREATGRETDGEEQPFAQNGTVTEMNASGGNVRMNPTNGSKIVPSTLKPEEPDFRGRPNLNTGAAVGLAHRKPVAELGDVEGNDRDREARSGRKRGKIAPNTSVESLGALRLAALRVSRKERKRRILEEMSEEYSDLKSLYKHERGPSKSPIEAQVDRVQQMPADMRPGIADSGENGFTVLVENKMIDDKTGGAKTNGSRNGEDLNMVESKSLGAVLPPLSAATSSRSRPLFPLPSASVIVGNKEGENVHDPTGTAGVKRSTLETERSIATMQQAMTMGDGKVQIPDREGIEHSGLGGSETKVLNLVSMPQGGDSRFPNGPQMTLNMTAPAGAAAVLGHPNHGVEGADARMMVGGHDKGSRNNRADAGDVDGRASSHSGKRL